MSTCWPRGSRSKRAISPEPEQALAGAREASLTSRALAETALLGAMLARATGSSFAAQAMEAARPRAPGVENLELVLEAHLLLAHANKLAPARGNLAAAAEIRDRMARRSSLT